MTGKSILIFIVVLILIYIIYRYVIKDTSTLSSLTSGTTMQTIEASSLNPNTSSGAGVTTDFTYSIWFYVDDWNYRYGETKVLFGRVNNSKASCPLVTFGKVLNNIDVSLAYYTSPNENTDSDDSTTQPAPDANFRNHNCPLANVPIQKWVNLLISLYGRTLDVYMDGKLVRTCILPNVPYIDQTLPLYITPSGGFSGWTSKFQYWPQACDPQKAWNIYKAGYGGSMFSSTYSVKISLMEGDTVDSSITI
jgi:hypothetical protein